MPLRHAAAAATADTQNINSSSLVIFCFVHTTKNTSIFAHLGIVATPFYIVALFIILFIRIHAYYYCFDCVCASWSHIVLCAIHGTSSMERNQLRMIATYE